MKKDLFIKIICIFALISQNNLGLIAEVDKCTIVDTGQNRCYNNKITISYPKLNNNFFGQDAQFLTKKPKYQDNGNGTITDLNTGLIWSKSVSQDKVSLIEAKKIAKKMTLGGYNDWRVPNIKELYSLIDFRGCKGFSRRDMSNIPSDAIPFLNTDYFDFMYGQVNNGERYIDAQWLSSTKYVSTTMNGNETLFGVNFADGRIKGYGYKRHNGKEKKFYVRYVRGNAYGDNNFVDEGDGTITDKRTRLMWMKIDSGKGMDWEDALKYAKNLKYAGYDDWRLPNAKELQYIVDYSRSPDTTYSPAIDPIFKTTSIVNEAGIKDYPYYWTSTTHLDGPSPGSNAVYIAFGRALGKMHGRIMDVHGAGAQRSDPKIGSSTFRGPQGDAVRVKNYVRCVRGGDLKKVTEYIEENNPNKYPNNIRLCSNDNKQNRFNNKSRFSKSFNRRKGFVSRLDKNGDNKVSRQEFDGPSHAFDHHDRNRDGYLSEDEAPHRRRK